jgi:hypothetical protein
MLNFLEHGRYKFAAFDLTITNNDVEVEEREAAYRSVSTYIDGLNKFISPDREEEVSPMLGLQ